MASKSVTSGPLVRISIDAANDEVIIEFETSHGNEDVRLTKDEAAAELSDAAAFKAELQALFAAALTKAGYV